jgi:hypothetical protein
MKHQARRRLILLAIVALPATFVLWKYVTLCCYQSFIHTHYAPDIKRLELAMLSWPESRFEDEDLRTETLHQELKQTFSSGDFYCANWSRDSHHGAKGTGIPGNGYSTNRMIWTTDDRLQSLCFGKSFEGVPLLVYEKWLPDSPVMKHMQIVFYYDRVSMSRRKASER